MRDVRTWIEIDTQALRHNVAVFRKLIRLRQGYGGHVGPRVRLMAVVKSNAYGHGLAQVAKFLSNDPRIISNDSRIGGFEKNSILFGKDSRKSLWFGVDSIVEALRLRREEIKNPILVLGYTLPQRYTEAAAKRIALTISHFEGLAVLARVKRRPAFHIKIDTGMHRQGFQEYEIAELIAALKKFRLKPQGVYSHFAAAENRAFSQKQIAGFERCVRALQDAGIRPGLRHMAATGGALYYPQARYDMVRIGLGLYGYIPLSKSQITNHKLKITVRPVMSWKTIVGEVKHVRKGEGIGYDLTERLKRDSTVAILPVGYWHGFDRGLSSIGEVLIHGKRAKVLGRVSMDMTAVDVTNINGNPKFLSRAGSRDEIRNPKVKIGDEAVLIGRQAPLEASPDVTSGLPRFGRGPLTGQGKEFIGADEMAEKISTTAYEVLTRVNPLIRRVVK